MPAKKYSYLVTISTGDRATSELLTRLKQNKRLGMFVSAAMESFLATEHGKKMADVFNPPKTVEAGPPVQDTASGESLYGARVPDAPQSRGGVDINLDSIFGA